VSKFEDKYGPTEIQPLEWNLAVEAIERLIIVASVLSEILGDPGRDFGQFKRIAKRDAKHFWEPT
jgi:hypothetical protein